LNLDDPKYPFLGPANLPAFGFFCGIFLVGLIVYFIISAIRKRHDIDFKLIYSDLPPE
jgi:hypothetical protein